jgi:hypothetical protein
MSPDSPLRIDIHIHTHPATVLWIVFVVSLALGVFLGSR